MSVLARLRRSLSQDRGDLVVDAMVGVLITGFVFTVIATISVTAASTTRLLTSDTQRRAFISEMTQNASHNADAVPTVPTTERYRIGGDMLPVTLWRETGPSSDIVFALTPSANSKRECNVKSQVDAADCITSRSSIDAGRAHVVGPAAGSTATGVGSRDGATVGPGVIATTSPRAGADEVRYVLKVSSSAAGSLTFEAGGETLLTVPFPAGQDGYLYGSVWLDKTAPVKTSISTKALVSDLLIYDAPAVKP